MTHLEKKRVLAHAAGTEGPPRYRCSGERSRGLAQACRFNSRSKQGTREIKPVRMNREMQALRGCRQSGGAAAPHAGPTTAIHASVRIDRRGARWPTCGQHKLVRDRTISLGQRSIGKVGLGELDRGDVMRHRMMMYVNMCLQAVGLVGMGAGQNRRKLNGDQDDHRTNKLPEFWVRVHQAHIITALSALHRSG